MVNNSNVRVNIIDYNKIYSSNNYGDFIFLEEVEPRVVLLENGKKRTERKAKIKFIQTGTIMTVMVRDAIRGVIKDPYYPKIYGVACVGNASTIGKNRILYNTWKSMINRKYNKNATKHKYYKNCIIDPTWLCFENFLKDAVKLPGYENMIKNPKIKYSLDKDTLQVGVKNKIYGPNTCMWIPMSENLRREAIDNKPNTSSKYFGITLDRGKYKVQSSVKTPYGKPIGMFTNEIAAVNIREWYRLTYYPNAIPNINYPIMPLDEAIQYKCRKKNQILLYHLNSSIKPRGNNNYFGVSLVKSTNNYRVSSTVRTPYGEVGTFDNEIAAVNAREWYRSIYFPEVTPNLDYPKMPLNEVVEHRQRRTNRKLLYHLINKDNE